MAEKSVSTKVEKVVERNVNRIPRKATDLPHIFLMDINDTGILEEVAIVADFPDGTVCYVQIANLHQIDKARLKKVVTSQHANKYQLWDLMSQSRLSNGLNQLDYFHQNFVKQKRPKGAKITQDSIANVNVRISDQMIGSDFSNPSEASLDKTTGMFNS